MFGRLNPSNRALPGRIALTLTILLASICSVFQISAHAQKAMTPEEETLTNLEKTLPAADSEKRFVKLSQLAAAAFDAGDYDKAQAYANELLSDADRYRTSWNYGNAIFYGNLMLGRVALKRDNNISQAASYLLAAGRTPGSPQLDSFGPNMSLAQDLLKAGERDTVLDFIDECRKFWKTGGDKLNAWKDSIDKDETPNFASNLTYF